MAFLNQRSPYLSLFLKACILMIVLQQTAQAIRVPAYIFPDTKSDIITYVEIDSAEAQTRKKVLDASLASDWYWTTHEDDYVGYVSKRDVLSRNQLRDGTMIRTNPTYRSWVLTKYQQGDKVRVRSRLSVGRVSFEKEIPVYYQLSDELNPLSPIVEEATPVLAETTTDVVTSPTSIETTPVETEIQSTALKNSEHESLIAVTEETVDPGSQAPVAVIPEVSDSIEPEPMIDPLLEEKPRIPAQELANMAPPPADLYQEFEGFLKLVTSDNEKADLFQYQLETKSGQRIVFVKVENLRSDSYEAHVNKWINIRGSLDEQGEDFTLYIDAQSIWVAPEQ